MMTMRKASFILLLLCAFTAWSCQEEIVPGREGSGTGSIELRLDSGKAIGLQTKTPDPLEEGLEFKNVLVILVNSSSGNVSGKVYKTYPYTPGSGDIQGRVDASSVGEDVIHFNGLLPGNYHVYAYANIDAAAWQQTGTETIANQENNLTVGMSFSGFKDRELATLTGGNVPPDPSTSMLLTGHKEIQVGLARVPETLDLLRPVVRFKVTVRNHTRFPVTVNDLRFSHFNPHKTYLLDHLDASGVPAVPAGATYRAMPEFDTSAGDDASVAANAEEVIYQRLIYENASPNAYKIYATLTLDRSSESMINLELSLGDHPFGVIDMATLNAMDEGEQVDVLVTNPQISPRSGRIFAYISSSNYMAWESAGYTNYNGFYNRALAIYNEEASYDYSSSYSNPANDGYSSWDGVSSTPSEATAFDYRNKRSQYFHTLTKNDGLFTLSGLAVSSNSKGTVTGTSISGIQFEAGSVVSGKNPSDVGGKLVRFINSSDGKSIQANTNWEQNEARQKFSNLMWQTGDKTKQDRQFMLFGKYLTGGSLKRILKENNKEVPLTYMARNEEINVILNVYYSDTDGELTFVVDNSTWKTATTSRYTFN